MRKLFKYVSKEFIPPFFMGVAAFIVFVSVELLYQLSEIIVRNHVGFSKLLILIWYHLPYFISMGIPVGVLFGVFWAISKLSAANEIIAFQTLGIPTKKFAIPFLVWAVIFCFFTFILFDTIVPNSNFKAKEAMALYVYQRPEAQIEENQFVDVGDGRYLFVRQIDRNTGILYDVLLYEVNRDSTVVFHAQKAEKGLNGWYMENGRMFKTNKDGFLDLDIVFQQIELDIQQDVEEFLNLSKGANEMTSKELREKIKTFSRLGLDVSGLIVSYQSKFANSLAPFVICILGIALSLFLNLTSKSWSVITTFILVVVYQGSGAWLTALGKEKIIDPLLSAWIPNIIFGIIGIFLFLILDTRFSYKLLEPLKRILPLLFVIFIGKTIFSAPVNITCDSFYLKDNLLILENGVLVEYEGSNIVSDRAEGELNDDGTIKTATFFGDVKYLYNSDISIEASEITVNFEKNAVLFLNSYTIQKYKGENDINVRIWSEKIEKPVDENVIHARDTKLTTCEDCITYYLSAKKVDIYPGYFLIARDVVLSFFGVPTLYLPFYFQSLSEDEEVPFSLTFAYGNNKISIETKINYKFENSSSFHLSNNIINELNTGEVYQDTFFRYGFPLFEGRMFIFSEIISSTNKPDNLGIYYEFFEKSKLELKIEPTINNKYFSLNIPKLKTNFGDLKNIQSHIYWDSEGFKDILFLNLETQAFQKRYGKSLISLSKIKLNSKSYGDLTDLTFEEIWNTRKDRIELAGKYNFYTGFTNMYGNFDYTFSSQGTETVQNRLLSNNTFSYKDTLYEYKKDDFKLKFNMDSKIRFNYGKDFVPDQKYSEGKTLFDYSLKPGIDINLGIFDVGNSLEYIKVLENSYSPSTTDEINYLDYLGYNLSFFENNLFHSARLTRTYDLMDPEDLFDLKGLKLETNNKIKVVDSENIIQTKTDFNIEDDNNIFPEVTSVKITNNFSNYIHRTEFDYKHEEDLKIEYFKNRETFKYNRNLLQLDYNLYLGETKFSKIIPEIYSYYVFYNNGNKIFGNFNIKNEYNLYELRFNFLEKNSKYSFGIDSSYFVSDYLKTGFEVMNWDKSEFANISFNYDIKDKYLNFTEFEIQKKIVCWTFNFKAVFSILPQPQIESFALTFFINYLPSKNVSFSDSGVNVGLM